MNINTITQNKKTVLILAVIVVAIFLFVIFYSAGGPQAPGVANNENSGTQTTGESSVAQNQSGSNGGGNTSGPLQIQMDMPAAGETWLLGKSHSIRWSAEGRYSGGVELIDAATNAVVGWITPSLTAHQTTVSWDTQSILLSKTSPVKKDIVPGVYIIRVAFDGSQAPVLSAPFQIIRTGLETIISHEVLMKSNSFVPNFLTVKQNDHVVVVNDDTVNHVLQMNGVTLATISPNSGYVFVAAGITSTKYELRMKEQVLPKLTITVQ